ncbi:MAG: hypothetical protein J6J93_00345, partial [Muribaculaceae bacterium]|nr:hypothetical protein [Muribaculaceae bacterium]
MNGSEFSEYSESAACSNEMAMAVRQLRSRLKGNRPSGAWQVDGSEYSEYSEFAEELVGGLRAPLLFDSSTPSACGGRGYWVVCDRVARAPDVTDVTYVAYVTDVIGNNGKYG